MRWRFYLIDSFNTKTGIEEPIGWDSFSLKLKRHAERHGTYRELQTNKFQFIGNAVDLLKAEKEAKGIRGNYILLIEGKCGNVFEEFYRGKISFDSYSFTCSTECYVTADVDQIGPLVQFINRFDQKVDLTKETAFDDTTPLTAYSKLSQVITLPTKAILLRGISSNTAVQEYIISNDSGWFPNSPTGMLQGGIDIPFSTTTENSIKDYTPAGIMDFHNKSNDNEYIPEIIYNNPTQDLNCTGASFDISFRVKGIYKNLVIGSGNQTFTLALKKGKEDFYSNATQLQGWILYNGANNSVVNQAFDISYTGTITLQPGEKLFVAFFLTYTKNTNYTADVRLQIDPETNFSASVISKCDPTTAKLYFINEATSRVIESITNNSLKLYASYLGRTDSEPYSFLNDGCGAQRALTMGLHIRNAKLSDGSEPKLFLSMKDIFESLSAIDNIGIGSEGEDKIRIENWKWFYQDQVVFTCRNIDKIESSIKSDECYSVFKCGYDKWEAEDYNGLDEFLTKREYRTSLSEVQNTLEKVSKFIASGYAIEVTRRKQNNTKDWRYDNDTFIICLTDKLWISAGFTASSKSISMVANTYFQSGDQVEITNTLSNNGIYTITSVSYFLFNMIITVAEPLVDENASAVFQNLTRKDYRVETGFLKNAANILDPDSIYNYRISPARNAMRWFDRVAQCYRHIQNTDSLSFSAGDGNYVAEGELLDDGCKLENGVLKENDAINLSKYNDPTDGTPILHPERVKFKYPLSLSEYQLIKNNPHGLIEYRSSCEHGYGWIDEMEYIPNEGQANFLLIPKVTSNG